MAALPIPAARYERAEVIDTIKQTVAKGATDAQLAMFLEVCKRTDRKSTRLNSSHSGESRMPSSA